MRILRSDALAVMIPGDVGYRLASYVAQEFHHFILRFQCYVLHFFLELERSCKGKYEFNISMFKEGLYQEGIDGPSSAAK